MMNGKGWSDKSKQQWLAKQVKLRSYHDDVITKIDALKAHYDVQQYGELNYQLDGQNCIFPLFIVQSLNWNTDKKTILITGGVHGYETSGVHGALGFLETRDKADNAFNIIVAPCISPWGYETINRWNPDALDPNRSFYKDSPAQEAALLMQYIESLNIEIYAHFDLHETTDTDNTVFRPALALRDGIEQEESEIPDGFYLVGDTLNPNDEFQTAMIKAVEKVTHIAPCDENNNIIGSAITQRGVINYPCVELGLCAGFSKATYCTTTEVYPDSETATPQDCINAQIAAIAGGLAYIKALK